MNKIYLGIGWVILFFNLAMLVACDSEVNPINDPEPPVPPIVTRKGSIDLRIYIPKSDVNTYAEDANSDENYIHSLWIQLFENGIAIDTLKLERSELTSKIQANTNDSILHVEYEVDNISSTGPLDVNVYANDFPVNSKVLTSTYSIIPQPVNTTPATAFFMSGKGRITADAKGNYTGTIHIQRDVAKVRINVAKTANVIPADLTIDYEHIKITIKNVADKADTFGISTPVGRTFKDYEARTGGITSANSWATLHPSPTAFNTTNGGQIDSIYIYENLAGAAAGNATSIVIEVPTTSPTNGTKVDTYTIPIKTDGSFDIIRNYIYTINLQIRGQDLEPAISVYVLPWNDQSINGTIEGTYIRTDLDEIIFDEKTGEAIVNLCSDGQAVYLSYSEDLNTAITNGNIQRLNIGTFTDATSRKDYVQLDKGHCSWFGFQITSCDVNTNNSRYFRGNAGNGSPDGIVYGSVIGTHTVETRSGGISCSTLIGGSVCLKVGNIEKCLSIATKKTYDAHFIVGDEFIHNYTLKSAQVTTEDGGNWLEVSIDKLYTGNATQDFSSASGGSLYLHLDENLTGSERTGYINLIDIQNHIYKVYITQLPALYVGGFGGEAASGIYDQGLWTEQVHEHGNQYSPIDRTMEYGSFYNLQYMGKSNFGGPFMSLSASKRLFENGFYDGSSSASPGCRLCYENALREAMHYCLFKNRDENKNGVIDEDEIKWYLPSQMQLMGMWVSYYGYWNAATDTTFKADTYWSATPNYEYAQVQYVNFRYGNVGHYNSDEKYWGRCVRNDNTRKSLTILAQGEQTIIDFSSLPEGSYTTQTLGRATSESESSSVNQKVFHKLLLDDVTAAYDNATTWTNAKQACEAKGSGWRLPTQRELQAIAIINPKITTVHSNNYGLGDAYYWTATVSSSGNANVWVVYGGVTTGSAGNTSHISQVEMARYRCVKEM